jgi:cell division protein FtsB
MTEQAKRMVNGRARWVMIGLLVALGAYLLFFTPVRTYIDQRNQMEAAEARYELLASTNEELRQRSADLESDDEIRRLARERYELVEPGEKAWAVMPAPTTPPPADQPQDDEGLWEKIWVFD